MRLFSSLATFFNILDLLAILSLSSEIEATSVKLKRHHVPNGKSTLERRFLRDSDTSHGSRRSRLHQTHKERGRIVRGIYEDNRLVRRQEDGTTTSTGIFSSATISNSRTGSASTSVTGSVTFTGTGSAAGGTGAASSSSATTAISSSISETASASDTSISFSIASSWTTSTALPTGSTTSSGSASSGSNTDTGSDSTLGTASQSSVATSSGILTSSGLITSSSGMPSISTSVSASNTGSQTTSSTAPSQSAWNKPVDAEMDLDGKTSGQVAYTIDIQVGQGNITVPVLVDTGSANLWVASSSCSGCNMVDSGVQLPDGCKSVAQAYGSGSVSGCLVTTNVSIGSYALQNFPLMAASTSDNFNGAYMSGMLGLAMNTTSLTDNTTPVNVMSKLDMISAPEVGFYLTRNGDDSEIIFGSEAESSPHADQSKKVALQPSANNNGLYTVTLDAFVSYGEKVKSTDSSVNMDNVDVVIDTGTTNIFLPDSMRLPIYAAIGNSSFFNDTSNADLVVPCDNFGNDRAFGLQFGGQVFNVLWSDLLSTASTTDANFCYLNIRPMSSGVNQIIIGQRFLHNVYHVVYPDTGAVTMYGLLGP